MYADSAAPSRKVARVLVHEILEDLYYADPGGTIDYRSLINCSTVCRLWASPAQRLLFRSLQLSTAAKAESFCLANCTNPINSLGRNVRILTLGINFHSRAAGVSPQLFARLVTVCVRLYELRISAPFVRALNQETLNALSDVPPIKALSIDQNGIGSTLLYQLLKLVPSVRHLRLTSKLDATPPDWAAPFRLYEFSALRAPHPNALTWLLSASHESLRILELGDMYDRGVMRKIMQTHGPHLLSLRITRINPLTVEMIQNCPNLRELMMWYVPIGRGKWDVPSMVEHLLFRVPLHSRTHTLEPILRAVRGLPNLQLVTCDKNTTGHTDFSKLSILCEQRGVELCSNASLFTVAEDPVPVTHFPRRKSVSNFRLMD